MTDRITTLDGAIIDDGLTPDEARAQHATLIEAGTAHLWTRWGGERTGFNNVARFDGEDAHR